MKALEDVITALKQQDLEAYREVIEYCDTRTTADEGIPAIIGLDDLTTSWDTVYEGAKADQDFNFVMAVGALVFATLYDQQDKEKLGNYPAIAPAMSATAEKFFQQGSDGLPIQYRDTIKTPYKK